MASVSTILMSAADVGQFTTIRQLKTEDDVRFDYTEESVKAILTQKAIEKSLILPGTTSLTINGSSVSVAASAGTGSRSRMIQLDVTTTGRKAMRTRRLFIGKRGTPSPMWFAYSTGSSTTLSNDVTCEGDVYNTGNVSGSDQLTVTGDFYTAESVVPSQVSVDGTSRSSMPIFNPTANMSEYQSAATAALSGNQNVTLLIFLTLANYQTLWYNNGDVTFDVTYSGKGTCAVNGNVTIKKFERNSSADQGLIIVNGNVDIQTNNVKGFIFCTGNVTYSGPGNLQVDGAIFCNNLDMGGKKLTLTFNPFFWDNPTFDKRMRVPGMW